MNANRRAFEACPETCGEVDSALADAASAIKKGATEKLRDALIEAYEQIESLEGDLLRAEEERDVAQRRADDLDDENRTMAREIGVLESRCAGAA